MKMSGIVSVATVLLLALAGAAEGADTGLELWSSPAEECRSGGSEQLQSLAVPLSEVQCANGGLGASSCEIRCNRMLGFYYSTCQVGCAGAYYACCNCKGGAICHCYLDHSELWPIAPRD
jgi:hypothetical protein